MAGDENSEVAAAQVPGNDGAAAIPDLDVTAVQSFLDQARTLASWHNERSTVFERRAGVLLGFTSLVLALMASIIKPIRDAPGGWVQNILLVQLVLSGAMFVLAGRSALSVLRLGTHMFADDRQVSREWADYSSTRSRSTATLTGIWVAQLLTPGIESDPPVDPPKGFRAKRDRFRDTIVGSGPPYVPGRTSVQSLADDADWRGRHLSSAFEAFSAGFILLASIGLCLIISGGAT